MFLTSFLKFTDVACFAGIYFHPLDLYNLCNVSKWVRELVLNNHYLVNDVYKTYYGDRAYLYYILYHTYIRDKDLYVGKVLNCLDMLPRNLLRNIINDDRISKEKRELVVRHIQNQSEKFIPEVEVQRQEQEFFDLNVSSFVRNTLDDFGEAEKRFFFLTYWFNVEKNVIHALRRDDFVLEVLKLYCIYQGVFAQYLQQIKVVDTQHFKDTFGRMDAKQFVKLCFKLMFKIPPSKTIRSTCTIYRAFTSFSWINISRQDLIVPVLMHCTSLSYQDTLSILRGMGIYDPSEELDKEAVFKFIIRYSQRGVPLSDAQLVSHRCFVSRDSTMFPLINYASQSNAMKFLCDFFDELSLNSSIQITEHQLCFIILIVQRRISRREQVKVYQHMLSAYVKRKLLFPLIFTFLSEHYSRAVAEGFLEMSELDQIDAFLTTAIHHIHSMKFDKELIPFSKDSPYGMIFNLVSPQIRLKAMKKVVVSMQIDEYQISLHRLNSLLLMITKIAFRDRYKYHDCVDVDEDFLMIIRTLLRRYEQDIHEMDSYERKYLDLLVPLINNDPDRLNPAIVSEIVYWVIDYGDFDKVDIKKLRQHSIWFFWNKILISFGTTPPTDQKWKAAFGRLSKIIKEMQQGWKMPLNDTQISILKLFENDLLQRIRTHKKF